MNRILISTCVFLALSACMSVKPPPPSAPTEPGETITKAIHPSAQLQKPDEVLADVMKNYNETTTRCLEYGTGRDRGHYYCSGVLARTVDNGNFNPWIYSPTAIAIGATSYSWLRQDVHQTALYHPAGFILRNRIDAVAHSLPGLESGFICLYPYDAGTSTANGHTGCGYRGIKNSKQSPAPRDDNAQYAWGSCEGRGITTAKQWDDHFTSVGYITAFQCSWNVDSQHGWNNMIASREDFPTLINVWNEIMLNNYGDGGQMPKYIAAFFYDTNRVGGLAAAQSFQVKMNNAGYNVPILKLNFNSTNANRFTYVPGDQAVPQ